jgi:hypothetical protein
MNDFKFKIRNNEWKVEIIEGEQLLEEYHKRQPDAYACLGLTFYKEHKIWCILRGGKKSCSSYV